MQGQSRHVSARTRETRDDTGSNGITARAHHNGDRRRPFLGRHDRLNHPRDQEIDLGSKQSRDKIRVSLEASLGGCIQNSEILPFHIPERAHLLKKRGWDGGGRISRPEEANAPDLLLRRRTAWSSDE